MILDDLLTAAQLLFQLVAILTASMMAYLMMELTKDVQERRRKRYYWREPSDRIRE